MIRLVIAVALAAAPAYAAAAAASAVQQGAPQGGSAAPPAQEQLWVASEDTVLHMPARIGFPRRAGALREAGRSEFSNHGEGIDAAVQYRSADGALIGTVYVYYPGLPHAGLAAWATDNGMRLNSPSRLDERGTRIVDAGGARGVAIRADYGNYRNGNASIAAFAKAGRWIVKLRVSGPEARRGEVEAAMSALLGGILWGVQNPPVAATPVTVGDCAAGTGSGAARPLVDARDEEVAAWGLTATFDGGGMPATDEASGARRDLPSRVPPALCLSSRIQFGGGQVPILRAAAGENPAIDGRTRLLAIISDSGDALEAVDSTVARRTLLFYHSMGETAMLGSYDGVPSDAQIAAILGGADRDGTRVRVRARHRPSGTDLQIITAPDPVRSVAPTT